MNLDPVVIPETVFIFNEIDTVEDSPNVDSLDRDYDDPEPVHEYHCHGEEKEDVDYRKPKRQSGGEPEHHNVRTESRYGLLDISDIERIRTTGFRSR